MMDSMICFPTRPVWYPGTAEVRSSGRVLGHSDKIQTKWKIRTVTDGVEPKMGYQTADGNKRWKGKAN
jgi:hypothetical protein